MPDGRRTNKVTNDEGSNERKQKMNSRKEMIVDCNTIHNAYPSNARLIIEQGIYLSASFAADTNSLYCKPPSVLDRVEPIACSRVPCSGCGSGCVLSHKQRRCPDDRFEAVGAHAVNESGQLRNEAHEWHRASLLSWIPGKQSREMRPSLRRSEHVAP